MLFSLYCQYSTFHFAASTQVTTTTTTTIVGNVGDSPNDGFSGDSPNDSFGAGDSPNDSFGAPAFSVKPITGVLTAGQTVTATAIGNIALFKVILSDEADTSGKVPLGLGLLGELKVT